MSPRFSAGDICNRIVVVAQRDDTLTDAARRMREQHVGCLVVVEPVAGGNRVVGLLTDRDIVTGVVARDVVPSMLRVGDVMTAEVVTAREAEMATDLLATMQRQGLRRLPVLDDDGRLQGLVTLDDLLALIAEQMHSVVQAIQAGPRRERRARP